MERGMRGMKNLVVGILAHVDAGKTTLSESMLYLSGSIRKLGRVDHQDAFLDTYDLERSRGITIFSKQAVFSLKDCRITLLDTPGHVDFCAEMERTLQVLDYAILVISGADGVQGHTQTLWRLLQRYKITVFLFVNKMDQDGTDREKLMEELPENLERELKKGRRAIVIGYLGRVWEDHWTLPENIRPLYTVILEDTIRPHARETLKFFRREGVQVKMISGDHITTVSQIARRAGLEEWEKAIDLSVLPGEVDYDRICEEYAVFARVTPKQKQELVKDLKRQGHQVAMTGDGVNDLLALREADCSIAVADGSEASRQISQIVLLNSDFTNLPQVVMEGRKVIHNVTRTAQVFFIKTIYSVLVSLFCLITNQSFPFIPIQITLVDACIEAYPSFLTISAADSDFYDCSAEKLSAVYTASSIYLCHYDRRNVWGFGGASFSV